MFIYQEKNGNHTYHLEDKRMTGVTTVLGCVGDKDNLMQWYANIATAAAFRVGVPDEFVLALDALIEKDRNKKLSTDVARRLDRAFPQWEKARCAPKRFSEQAAKVGQQAHELCELFERGLIDPPPPTYEEQAITRAQAYVKWYGENIRSTLFVEKPLFSRKLFIGGTPDGGFLTNDGKFLINDKKFKGSIFSPHPFWQMAAYRLMIEEMASDGSTPMRLEYADGSVEEFASPKEYLASLGTVKWDGSVVILVDETPEVRPLYRYAYEQDSQRFREAVNIYRDLEAFKTFY